MVFNAAEHCKRILFIIRNYALFWGARGWIIRGQKQIFGGISENYNVSFNTCHVITPAKVLCQPLEVLLGPAYPSEVERLIYFLLHKSVGFSTFQILLPALTSSALANTFFRIIEEN